MTGQFFSIDTEVVLTFDETDKITWDDLAHVQQLEEGVLAIGTRFTKVNFTNRVIYLDTMTCDLFAIGL